MKRVKLNKVSLFTLLILFTPFFTLSIIFPIKTSSELNYNRSINNLINLSSEDPEFPWTSNGIPIYAGSGSQQYPQLCSDDKGGAIFVWQDSRSGTLTDIYAQKIDSAGIVQWLYEGVLICTTSEAHQEPQICSDGDGGAIIAWEDSRFGLNIYAQRVNSSGDVQWVANGNPICTGLWTKEDTRVCSDENGGAIITWADNRGGASNYQVYSQRINSNGNVQWTPNGELISQSGIMNIMPQITGDGKGGAFIIWLDSVNFDIYIQYININGILQWIGDKSVCTEINPQIYHQICSDGNGGAFIVWQDRRSGITIYSQMIDSVGILHWTPNGTLISTTASSSSRPELCNDGDGGVIITWEANGIHAQRVNSSGSILWTVDGKAICIETGAQQDPQITSDRNGGCFITWEDTRNGNFDVYAQLVNSTGDVQWTTNGFPICTVINDQVRPQICSGGKGGAIIVWFDSRFEWGIYDIFAQMVKEKVSIIINSPENKIYDGPMSGYYPATCGFESDRIGSEPEWFDIIGTLGGTAVIIEELNDHKKILELYDISDTYNAHVRKDLSETPTHGTVEYWMRTDNISKLSGFRIDNGGNFLLTTRTWNHYLQGTNGTTWTNITLLQNNIWYHMRIDFECTTGFYQELSQYSWSLYVNGIKYGVYDFISNESQADKIWWYTDFLHGLYDYRYYIDAIGYSWDPNYNVGSNLDEGLLLDFDVNSDLNWSGFSLDGQHNTSISGDTVIPLPNEGVHIIQVFGNDSLGKIYQSEQKNFIIDTIIPEILIHSPNQDEIFGIFAPKFNFSVFEANLISVWYTMDNGITNISITEVTGYLDQEAWQATPKGPITIRFYAKDINDNTIHEEVIVIKEIVKQMQFVIADQSFSTDNFNITFFIHNETYQGIDLATIQMWWNGTDVSDDVINLGNGLYFVSLEPITVAPGEDPILLMMVISASGYEDKHFETYLSVDPDTLEKGVDKDGEEFPLTIVIIAIVSTVGGIGATLITIGIFRKSKPTKEVK